MKFIDFEAIDSTNTYLKHNHNNLEDFTFVSAKYQSKGRGRGSRVWKSENGTNLLFSLLIKEESLINKFKEISIISAYSLIQVLEEKYHIPDLSIKWPNDIYYRDSKICGILLEAVSSSSIDCLIVGHSHKPFVTKPQKIIVDGNNNLVKTSSYTVVGSTSWLSYGGYALRKMLLPASESNPQKILLKCEDRHKGKDVQIIW